MKLRNVPDLNISVVTVQGGAGATDAHPGRHQGFRMDILEGTPQSLAELLRQQPGAQI